MFEAVKIKDVKLSFGQSIKTLRKKNKISQEELANQLDLSRITIQNLESGKNFTIDTLLKVLQHFDLLKDLNTTILNYQRDNESVQSLY